MLRQKFTQAVQAKMQTSSDTPSWADLVNILTSTATETFGLTEITQGKPWLAGHATEIRHMANQISSAKTLLTQHRHTRTHHTQSHPHDPQAQQQMHQSKRALHLPSDTNVVDSPTGNKNAGTPSDSRQKRPNLAGIHTPSTN